MNQTFITLTKTLLLEKEAKEPPQKIFFFGKKEAKNSRRPPKTPKILSSRPVSYAFEMLRISRGHCVSNLRFDLA